MNDELESDRKSAEELDEHWMDKYWPILNKLRKLGACSTVIIYKRLMIKTTIIRNAEGRLEQTTDFQANPATLSQTDDGVFIN